MLASRHTIKIISLCFFTISTLLISLNIVTAQDVGIAENEKILAWVAAGADVGQHGASSPGQIVYFNPDGSITPLFDVPERASKVMACGNDATSPDNSLFAFFMGGDVGDLYMIRGAEMQPTLLATDLNSMACVGNGTFQFNPTGTHFGYMVVNANFIYDTSASARLFIQNTEDYGLIGNFENVTAFDLTDEGGVFVTFFNNNAGQAVEVGINVWDGTVDREVATIFADPDCFYSSASIDELPDKRLAVVMNYRCNTGNGRTNWQFFVVDPETRSATMIASDLTGGAYFSSTRTNNVFSAPDANTVFFTGADGLSTFSTFMNSIDVITSELRQIFPNHGVMPRLTNLPYDRTNHVVEVSPDGNFLAFVRNNPNNEATLTVIDLTLPDFPPIEIEAGGRNQFITEMFFTPDSSKLYFVAGGNAAGNNSLFSLDLFTGVDDRIRRGRYGQGVISPDGSKVALINYQVLNDDEPPIFALVTIDMETTGEAVFYVGAEIVEGRVQNQIFAYPLSWRQD